MVITQNISVDLLRQNTNPVIQAKQYDVNSRFLNVTVLADGEAVRVSQTDIVRINVLRADNESNSFVGTVNANGTITVPIDGWILLVPGKSKLSVSISSATNSEIKSLSFQIYVEPAEYKKDVYVVYYARSEAITAGSYYVEIDNRAYSFTLGESVPVGGVIAFNFAFTLASTYTSSALENEIETNLPVVNSETGTELEEVNPILQSVIDSVRNKAEADNVYTKHEVDILLSEKAFRLAVEAALADKVDKTALETKLTDKISLEFNSSTYVLTLKYTDDSNTVHTLGTVDLPLENILIGASVSGNILTMTFKLGTDETKTVSIDLSIMLSEAVANKANAADVGSLSSLTTTVKTSIVAAINEINSGLSDKANASDVYAKADTYNKTEVDTALSGKADQATSYTKTEVDTALAGKQATLTFDNAPTANSDNPVKSGGVKTALDGKQDALTFDSTPTENSTNPVTSGGIKAALDEKVSPNGTVANAEQLVPTTGFTTNNAFNTRKTAAEINTVPDVLNGNVQIKKIKGNTINWNQLCTNGNFNGTTGWLVNSSTAITSFTASDNVATLEVASSGSIYCELRLATVGHKYAMRYTIRSSVDNVRVGTNYGEGASGSVTQYFTIGTDWTICSRLLKATSTARYFYVYVNTAGTYNVKNAMLFDLTQMFGEGNEPTLDEFNEMFPEEYYTATDSELVSCKPSGMQTVGFNLCSCASIFEKTFTAYPNQITGDDFTTVKNWLKSLQRYNQQLIWSIDNVGYTGDGSGFPVGTLHCRDSSTNPIIAIRPDVEFSLNSIDIDSIYQIFFYGRNDQTITFSNACMHFVWSGARNGDYEPYQQNTLAIDTATYFPDGMRSTPTVYDEIDFVNHKAITRCDMRAYQSGDESDSTVITDGINTIYARTTPTEVSIPADANNTYYADDWGTETWLQTGNPNPVAPVGSELLYFVNLRDKLQHLPFLASEDGSYIIKQTGTQMELIPGYSKSQVDTIVGDINSILDSINGEVV